MRGHCGRWVGLAGALGQSPPEPDGTGPEPPGTRRRRAGVGRRHEISAPFGEAGDGGVLGGAGGVVFGQLLGLGARHRERQQRRRLRHLPELLPGFVRLEHRARRRHRQLGRLSPLRSSAFRAPAAPLRGRRRPPGGAGPRVGLEPSSWSGGPISAGGADSSLRSDPPSGRPGAGGVAYRSDPFNHEPRPPRLWDVTNVDAGRASGYVDGSPATAGREPRRARRSKCGRARGG